MNPVDLLNDWLAAAEAAGLHEPTAMTLATAGPGGAPSARMVLLKEANDDGLTFFSNYGSRKGDELDADPRAAVVFYLGSPIHRQVRASGTVERLPAAKSDEYWATRPRGSQIAAAASAQSRPLAGREELERRVAELEREFAGRDVPRPEEWGGYVLRPEEWEFWTGQPDRLHERVRLTKHAAGWTEELLSP